MAKVSQGSTITESILNVPPRQPAAARAITAPPLSGPDSGVAPSHLAGVIKAKERETVYSQCDETHILSTIENLVITPGHLTFAAAGSGQLLACGRAQVFEIVIQSDTPGGFQLFEGGNGSQPISGHWTLSAQQFWVWGGKIVNGNVFITVDQACTIQFEARSRVVV